MRILNKLKMQRSDMLKFLSLLLFVILFAISLTIEFGSFDLFDFPLLLYFLLFVSISLIHHFRKGTKVWDLIKIAKKRFLLFGLLFTVTRILLLSETGTYLGSIGRVVFFCTLPLFYSMFIYICLDIVTDK